MAESCEALIILLFFYFTVFYSDWAIWSVSRYNSIRHLPVKNMWPHCLKCSLQQLYNPLVHHINHSLLLLVTAAFQILYVMLYANTRQWANRENILHLTHFKSNLTLEIFNQCSGVNHYFFLMWFLVKRTHRWQVITLCISQSKSNKMNLWICHIVCWLKDCDVF